MTDIDRAMFTGFFAIQDLLIVQVSAGEILAQSMMALLPGIDANDEHKAQSVFQFYTIAFSSLPVIEVRPALPVAMQSTLAPDYGMELEVAWCHSIFSVNLRVLTIIPLMSSCTAALVVFLNSIPHRLWQTVRNPLIAILSGSRSAFVCGKYAPGLQGVSPKAYTVPAK